MPEFIHDNTAVEQAWDTTFNVTNNDVTTRSHVSSSVTTNQGSYTDGVFRLGKVFTRFNKVIRKVHEFSCSISFFPSSSHAETFFHACSKFYNLNCLPDIVFIF